MSLEQTTLTVRAQPVEQARRPRPRIASSRPRNPMLSVFLYILRMGIVGVGVAGIAGTVMTAFNPVKFFREQVDTVQATIAASRASGSPIPVLKKTQPPQSPTASSKLPYPTQEVPALRSKLEAIAAKYPKLQPQAYFADLDRGTFVNFRGDAAIAAASTIKLPILVAFFQAVDRGKVYLDEPLTVTEAVMASGSGDLQYKGVGQRLTALETATKMIAISDNTATNMLVDRLGGKEILNAQFKEWGMGATAIRNRLPDLEGTNTTRSKDLARLLDRVNRGELISLKSRDRLLRIMAQTTTRTLLPQGIEKDAAIAHKTGDIGTMLGDAGIIDMPNGKRMIAVVLSKRPHNDPQGRTLIQEMARAAYQHFKWYYPRQSSAPKPQDPPKSRTVRKTTPTANQSPAANFSPSSNSTARST